MATYKRLFCSALLMALQQTATANSSASTATHRAENPAASPTAATPTLRIMVASGFLPVFKLILPRLQQKFRQPIVVEHGSIAEVYDRLDQLPATDLIITPNRALMTESIATGKIDGSGVRVLGQTVPVLWCPNPKVRMRVSWRDTLAQPEVQRLAASTWDKNPLSRILASAQPLPAQIQLVESKGAIDAWRNARRNEADCAITIRGLVPSTERAQPIARVGFELLAAIPKNSSNREQARLLVEYLSSPSVRLRLQQSGY